MRGREEQPTFVTPMLLTPGAVSSGDVWTYELKWDGGRAQLRYDGRSLSLRTRNAVQRPGSARLIELWLW
jgi:ATP-dependent DNA ligase